MFTGRRNTSLAPPPRVIGRAKIISAPTERAAAATETVSCPAARAAAATETLAAPAERAAAGTETLAAPTERAAAPAETLAVPAERAAAATETLAAPAEGAAAATETAFAAPIRNRSHLPYLPEPVRHLRRPVVDNREPMRRLPFRGTAFQAVRTGWKAVPQHHQPGALPTALHGQDRHGPGHGHPPSHGSAPPLIRGWCRSRVHGMIAAAGLAGHAPESPEQ